MKALIVVDVQFDFADSHGALYVEGGEQIAEEISDFMERWEHGPIVFTQDWHPEGHVSFKKWPEHCVAGSKGAELYIDDTLADLILRKGFLTDVDSYSAFADDASDTTGLREYLLAREVTEVVIVGLAADFCVNATAMDAALSHFKFKTSIIRDLTAFVHPQLEESCRKRWRDAGIDVVESYETAL